MESSRHRLIVRDAVPDSSGGIYNPGAILLHDHLFVLVRRERDYTWTKPAAVDLLTYAYPYGGVVGPDLSRHTLVPVGHDPDARLEDARPFYFNGQVLVAHVRWKPHDRAYPIKPVLSVLSGEHPTLTRYDDWKLPQPLEPVEKNWVLFEHAHTLHMVYSLSPLVIYAYNGGKWILVRHEENRWATQLGKLPRNSTHLVPYRGGYLGWWHIILDQSYVTGAYCLDGDLRLVARTGVLFDGSFVKAADDIYKPGVLYIASQVMVGHDWLLLFYGEGDSHSGVIRVAQADVAEALGIGL